MSDLLIKCHQSITYQSCFFCGQDGDKAMLGWGKEGVRKGLQRKRNRDDSTRMEELDLAGSINTLLVPAYAKCF